MPGSCEPAGRFGSQRRMGAVRKKRSIRLILSSLAAVAVSLSVLSGAASAQSITLGIDDEEALMTWENQDWWRDAFRDANSSLYRFMVNWATVAPTKPANATNPNDPAYNWSTSDTAVRFAQSSGQEPLFSNFTAPTWAEGPNRPTTGYGPNGTSPPMAGSWNPNAAELKKFATALARRYDGTTPDPLDPSVNLPRVALYEAWNEPNYKMYLSPQYDSSGGSTKLVVIDRYRTMLNSFYEGVKLSQPTATVSVGGLGPYGSSSQGLEVGPQLFMRGLMCLAGSAAHLKRSSSCPTKAKLDAFSIHPYTFFGTPTTKAASPDGGAFGNTPDFKKTLDYAVAKKTILPSGRKQLWATEFGWLTDPPGRPGTTGKISIGVKPSLAAVYVSEGIYRMWSWGLTKAFYFRLRDLPMFPAGLYFWPLGSTKSSEAKPKPTLRAFRFPFMAIGRSGRIGKVWALSPCRGEDAEVSVEFGARGRWTEVASFTPDSSGMISESIVIPSGSTQARGYATGTGCAQRGVSMPLYSK